MQAINRLGPAGRLGQYPGAAGSERYEPRGDRLSNERPEGPYFLPPFAALVALPVDLLVALLAVFFAGITFTSSGHSVGRHVRPVTPRHSG